MEEEPNECLTCTKLSLDITDIHASFVGLQERLDMLTKENELLRSQLEESIQHPPIQKPFVEITPDSTIKQFQIQINNLENERDEYLKEIKEMKLLNNNLRNEKISLEENSIKTLSVVEQKIHQFEIAIQAILQLPAAYVKESELIDDDLKEAQELFKISEIERNLEGNANTIESLRSDVTLLTDRVKILINENNRLSSKCEMLGKKINTIKQGEKDREEIWKKKEEIWKQTQTNGPDKTVELFEKCCSIESKIREVLSGWKNSENILVDNVERTIGNELNEQIKMNEIKSTLSQENDVVEARVDPITTNKMDEYDLQQNTHEMVIEEEQKTNQEQQMIAEETTTHTEKEQPKERMEEVILMEEENETAEPQKERNEEVIEISDNTKSHSSPTDNDFGVDLL
ncbi:Uncharacterized protein QTN25_006129 [Entamoeba marina]